MVPTSHTRVSLACGWLLWVTKREVRFGWSGVGILICLSGYYRIWISSPHSLLHLTILTRDATTALAGSVEPSRQQAHFQG